ncbi:hypothetical protein POM88_036233 [Heracleum sosnowskyi]|uniref:Uncharacterized protein n=1 Tax=Heracleum sosnowskyi TaxID=360622 RepID=A0AAD8ME11_9APIA|nr:hypothetical protein POM88_036233 [Heracleum sosnowskyi]
MDSEEAAALVLCSMKNSKVDYETSLQIEKIRRLFLLPSLSNNHSRLLSGTVSRPCYPNLQHSIREKKRLTASDIQLNQDIRDGFYALGTKAYVITVRNWFQFCVVLDPNSNPKTFSMITQKWNQFLAVTGSDYIGLWDKAISESFFEWSAAGSDNMGERRWYEREKTAVIVGERREKKKPPREVASRRHAHICATFQEFQQLTDAWY